MTTHKDPWIGLITSRLGITSSNLWHKKSLEMAGLFNEQKSSSEEYYLLFELLKNGVPVQRDSSFNTIVYERPESVGKSQYHDRQKQIWEYIFALRIEIRNHLINKNKYNNQVRLHWEYYMYSQLEHRKHCFHDLYVKYMPHVEQKLPIHLLMRPIVGRNINRVLFWFSNTRSYAYNLLYSIYTKTLMPRRVLFGKIYKEHGYGRSNNPKNIFYSGPGSHEVSATDDYLKGVQHALGSFCRLEKPSVVDLGCGDFAIGSKIRHLFGTYIACDLVKPLIKYNKAHFKHLDVDFRVLDMVNDKLPSAEVVIIRQVFQHLPNRGIKKILKKVWSNYKYLILTEHLPASKHFTPNIDISAGPEIRLKHNSGIVITEPPFLYKPVFSRLIASSNQMGGLIVTTLYQIF